MGSLGWAVALSVLSAASYAAAAVAQERLADHGNRGLSRWGVALLLTAGGVGLHVVALNFGTAFGISSVLSKAVIAAFTDGGAAAVSPFVAGAVVVLSVGGYLLGQLSYQGAGLAAPLATVSVVNPVVAAIAGIVVFDEGFRF